LIRHARYGPRDHYLDPPPAGMCMSVFAFVTRGDKVLVGVPKPHAAWKDKWLFSWATYSQRELQEAYRDRRLPSSYLLEGEDPREGLGRVMAEQLRVRSYRARGPRVFSYLSPSDWYPGHKHWDLAFVYDVKVEGPVGLPPWWGSLGFEDRKKIRASDFGWNSDLVTDIGAAVASGKKATDTP